MDLNSMFTVASLRFIKTVSIWVSVLWCPLVVAIAIHWPPGLDLLFDIELMISLLIVAIAGSSLLKTLLKEPGHGFLPLLLGLVLGAVLPTVGGLLWVALRPGFEESGIWLWGVIMGIPGAVGGALAAWSQWVSKTPSGIT